MSRWFLLSVTVSSVAENYYCGPMSTSSLLPFISKALASEVVSLSISRLLVRIIKFIISR